MEYFIITWVSIALLFFWQLFLLKRLGNEISVGINGFTESFNQIFEKDTVKRAMSIVGKMGGDTKSVNAIKNTMAKGFIEQNYGLIKMVADQVLGIDADEMIERYGAENILTAIQQLAPKLGIDLSSVLNNGLKSLNVDGNININQKSVPEMR